MAPSIALVDLSHPVTTGMPVYPGDPPVQLRPWTTVAADGYAVAQLDLGSHSGTHVDAPSHFIASGTAVDEVDLGRLMGPAALIDCRGYPPAAAIGPAAFADQVLTDRIVLVHTGWDDHWGTDAYLDHPVLSPAAAHLLRDQRVRAVAIDALSVDASRELTHGFPAHVILLGAGIPIAENLRGLAQLSWPVPMVSMLPLRLAGADGAPVRAVAWPGALTDPGPGALSTARGTSG